MPLRDKLEAIVQGIDPATESFDEKTVVGVLQRNFTLGQFATDQELTIDYTTFPRGRESLDVTEAAVITALIEERIPIVRVRS